MKAEALAKTLEPLIAAGLSTPWWKDDRSRHCAYCGIKMRLKADGKAPTSPTRDHLVPSCHDGPDLTVPACLECNRAKGAKSLPEFLASVHFKDKRSTKNGKAWPEHELWAIYSVAALRRTHELMIAATKIQAPKAAPKAAIQKTPAAKPPAPQPAPKTVHAPFPPDFLRCTLKT